MKGPFIGECLGIGTVVLFSRGCWVAYWFGWMCWKVNEMLLGICRAWKFFSEGFDVFVYFSAPVFQVFFPCWFECQDNKTRSWHLHLEGHSGSRATGSAAGWSGKGDPDWLLYTWIIGSMSGSCPTKFMEFPILRWYGDPTWMTPVKTANKKWVKSQSCSIFCSQIMSPRDS